MEINNNGEDRQQIKPTTDQVKKVDLNDWLPITQSRKGNWWYSAFHNVTAMVGAGVLGLPYAMSQLGWYPAPAAFFFSSSFYLILRLHWYVHTTVNLRGMIFLLKIFLGQMGKSTYTLNDKIWAIHITIGPSSY